jgi:hypothetical protein
MSSFTSKTAQRVELERLMSQYDGPVIRTRHDNRVTLVCPCCGQRRRAHLQFVSEFKPTCLRCGGQARIEP